MFNSVDFCSIHNRFVIRGSHAQVESGNSLGPYMIFPGYIDTWFQLDMVNGKACDFFHFIQSFLII